MMAGKSVSTVLTSDSVEAQVAGHIKAAEVMEGLVDAFIEACRTSIPAVHLPGQTTFQSTHVHLSVDVVAQHVRLLREQIADAEKRADRAMRRELEAEDDEEETKYRELGREARKEARRAREQIAEMIAEPETEQLDGPFDAYTSVLLPAMANLRSSGGRLRQEGANALETLMPTFRMEQRHGRWWCVATVRVNTVDGVAELGPIEWPMKSKTKGTSRLVSNLAAVPDTGANSKRQLMNQLVSTGRITHPAAAVLRNAPFQQLPHVVLHGLTGTPVPDWVGEEWTQPEFVAWVTKVYADPAFTWLGNGKYGEISFWRQAVMTFASRKQGPFTAEELHQELPMELPDNLYRLSRAIRSHKGIKIRVWQPSVLLLDDRHSPTPRRVAGIACECGEIASISARVPEVTRDLLCDCGRMPEAARFGMDLATRFPAEYRQLRMPWDDCVAELGHTFEQRRNNLTGPLAALLNQHQLLTAGATERELEEALGGKGSMWSRVRRLEGFGYLQRDTGRPARVFYTPEGRRAAGLPPE